MRKRDEIAYPNSCLNKAKPDEWLFVILGRDAAGPNTIREWIRQRIALGLNKPDDGQIIEAELWVASVESELSAKLGATQ